jgi:hypothetical protein
MEILLKPRFSAECGVLCLLKVKNKHQPVASEESCLINSKRIGFQVPTANKVGTHTFWYKNLINIGRMRLML